MPSPLHPAIAICLLVIGIGLTYFGAEFLIKGSARLARRLGFSPFVIGVTVVAFGTSAPEMFATVKASIDGNGELGVGNVVGSNIANVCLILGIAAVIRPIPVAPSILRRDVPLMAGITVFASAFMLDGRVGRVDGSILLASIVGYVMFNYAKGRTDLSALEDAIDLEHEHGLHLGNEVRPPFAINLFWTVAGLLCLTFGAAVLVRGGVDLARAADIPEIAIGATIIAFGTSVPELAASAQAARRNEADIAIGNVLGSNVFNLLAVLGAGAVARPIRVSQTTLYLHVPAMILVAFVLLPIIGTGRRIGRTEGVLLVSAYFAYAVGSYFLKLN